MGKANLNAFDLLAHFSEAALNRGLKMLPSGSVFPASQRKEVPLTSIAAPIFTYLYDTILELERPLVSLDQNAPDRVKITCELSPSSVMNFKVVSGTLPTGTLFKELPQIPLEGHVEFVCPLAVAKQGNLWAGGGPAGESVLAQLSDPNVLTTMTLTSPPAGNVQLGTLSVTGLGGVITTTVVNATAASIALALQQKFTTLATRVGPIPLTTPIPLRSGARALQSVTSVTAEAMLNPLRAIGIGLITGITPAAGGSMSIPAPPSTLKDATDGVLQASNNWLTHLVAQLISDKNPGITWTFTAAPPTATFAGSVAMSGDGSPFTLKGLTLSVNATSGIDVVGSGTASGACWTATVGFTFNLTFGCDTTTGEIMPVSTAPVVSVGISVSAWCIFLGVIIGLAVGIIIGGLIGGIALAIVGGFAANGLISPSFMPGVNGLSSLGGLALPLPVGSPGLSIDLCTLDDLEVSGRVQYADLALRASQGSFALPAGFGIDLDTGQIGSLPGPVDADLAWTGAQLQRANGATIATYFGSYNGLSLTDLESLTYATQPIAASQIPVQLPLTSPRLLTFAVRTSAGRYARCTVWCDTSMMLHISWVTYQGLTPLVTLVSTATTTSSTVIDQGTDNCMQLNIEYVPSVEEVLGLLGGGPQPGGDPTPWERSTRGSGVIPRASRYGAGWPGGGGPTDGPPRPPVGGGQPHGGLGDITDILKNAPNIGGVHIGHEVTTANWQVVDRAQRVTIVVLVSGLEVPLTFRWSVFGTDLGSGTGQTVLKGVTASFDDGWNTLILEAPEGTDIIGQVCVVIIDNDGRTSQSCAHLDQPGRTRLGGCRPQAGISYLDFLGQAHQFSRMSGAMAGMQERVALMAASGDARPVAAIRVQDAIRLLERGRGGGKTNLRTRVKRSRKG